MADTRELKLKLTIDAPDPSKSSRAFQDIAAQANKASLAVQDANRQMQKMQGPAALGNGSPGGSTSWTRPGFTGRPESISWTRPGFTGAAAPPAAAMASPSLAVATAPGIAAASAINGHQSRATSAVSAFDRPQSVVIVGPRPLAVTMVGGMPGVSGGGIAGGPKAAAAATPAASGLGAAAAVAAIATTAAAFGNLTEAIAQASQPTTTAADRFTLLSQAMAKSVPIIGDSLASIVGSLQNAAGRLTDWKGSQARDKYRGEFPTLMAKDAIRAQGVDQLDAANRMPRAARAAVASQEQFPTLAYQAATKTGLSGALGRAAWESKDEREKAAMEGVQAAKRSLMEADAAATSAKVDVSRQRSRTADANEKAGNATMGREAADRRAQTSKPSSLEQWAGTLIPGLGVGMGLAGRGPLAEIGKQKNASDERAQQLLVEQRAITQALKEQERLMAAQERSGQASLEAAKKRNELSKAETALMKTRIDLMQEELQKSRGATREFNGMDSVAQRDFASTFERFKTGGRDALTNEEFSQLQSSNITGDFVNKRLEKEGGDKPNAILSGLMKDVGLKDAQTLEAQIGKAKAELAVKVQVDEENFRKVMKEEMEKLNSDLTGMIKKIVSTELKLEDTKFAAGRATAS